MRLTSRRKTFFVYLSACILLNACSSATPENNVKVDKTSVTVEKNLDGLMAHFTQSDLQVGEKTEKYYGILAAENGFGVSINGIDVEVYQFNTSIGSGQKALDAIIKEGLMGSPVYKNGDLILVENKSHPKWNEILSSFQSY